MIYSIIAAILLFYAIYMLIMMTASSFYKASEPSDSSEEHSFLIFYPAFKPTQELINHLEYVKDQITGLDARIYVLSQDGDESINKQIKEIADYVDEASFSSHQGNAYHHALQYAVSRMSEISTKQNKVESVLIMDPDNFIDKHSIRRLIQGRLKGADVVLSRRVAYSAESTTGAFDGLSERINDHMMRRAKQVLGLTPELSGSGMMIHRNLFEKAVFKLDTIAPGMDKQLLINMMFEKNDLNIQFDDMAIVYDEKTKDTASFNRQRLRWFGNQYYNARKFGYALLKSGRMSLIDYAIALWRPPRSLQIALSNLFVPVDILLFVNGFIPLPIITMSALLINISILTFLISEGKLNLLLSHTLGFFQMSLVNGLTAVKSLLKRNQGRFLHTRLSK